MIITNEIIPQKKHYSSTNFNKFIKSTLTNFLPENGLTPHLKNPAHTYIEINMYEQNMRVNV